MVYNCPMLMSKILTSNQYRVNWKTLTVEVIVQEFEQLVVLLGEVGEVDEKPEKPNKRFKH